MKRLISGIPIIGGLPAASVRSHIEAGKESFLTIIFAVVPIWLPLIIALFAPQLPVKDYILKLVGEGELFLYACAFVGPLIYALHKNRALRDKKDETGTLERQYVFPHGLSFIVVSFFICFVCAGAFPIVRLSLLEKAGYHLDERGVLIYVICNIYACGNLLLLCLSLSERA